MTKQTSFLRNSARNKVLIWKFKRMSYHMTHVSPIIYLFYNLFKLIHLACFISSGLKLPFSVIILVMRLAGTTSKAGFQTLMPEAAIC